MGSSSDGCGSRPSSCKASVNPSTETMSVLVRSAQRRLRGERPSGRLDLLAGQQAGELLDRPRRQPGAHRDVARVRALGPRGWVADASLRRTALTNPRSRSRASPTVSPTAACCGDVGEQHLVGAEAQHVARAGAHARHRPGGDAVERPVDRPQVPDRAEREIGGEGAVASVEARAAQRRGHDDRGVGILIERRGGSPRAPRSRSARSASPEPLPRFEPGAARPVGTGHPRLAHGHDLEEPHGGPPRVSTTGAPSWAICSRPGPRIDVNTAPHGPVASACTTFSGASRKVVIAPGAGASARTRRRPLPCIDRPVEVALLRQRAWARPRRQPHPAGPQSAVPSRSDRSASTTSGAAEAGEPFARAIRRRPSPRSGPRRCSTMGPVSRPSSSSITLTPVVASPSRIARCTGAAPRHRGNREKWRLRLPSVGSVQDRGRAGALRRRRPRSHRARRPRAPARPRPIERPRPRGAEDPDAAAASATGVGRKLRPAPGRPGRIRDDANDLDVIGLGERFERRDRPRVIAEERDRRPVIAGG